MTQPNRERRTLRAADPATALRHKLESARTDANLEAVVLANAEGLSVAQSGDHDLCEQLAAYAPLWRERACVEDLTATPMVVQPLSLEGAPLYLAWSGEGQPSWDWLHEAGRGVRRILSHR